MKQLSWVEKIIEWLFYNISNMLPETCKRYVLYELIERASVQRCDWNGDPMQLSAEKLYETLRDK